MNLLGIDYGIKRMGFAFSQGELAEQIGTFPVNSEKQRLQVVLQLCRRHEIDTIIVGKTSGTVWPKIERFTKSLKPFFDGEVHFVEEAMTTREAQVKLIAAGTGKKKRKKNLDAYAAVLILQSYLDDREQSTPAKS